jgi:hypothetical protein
MAGPVRSLWLPSDMAGFIKQCQEKWEPVFRPTLRKFKTPKTGARPAGQEGLKKSGFIRITRFAV